VGAAGATAAGGGAACLFALCTGFSATLADKPTEEASAAVVGTERVASRRTGRGSVSGAGETSHAAPAYHAAERSAIVRSARARSSSGCCGADAFLGPFFLGVLASPIPNKCGISARRLDASRAAHVHGAPYGLMHTREMCSPVHWQCVHATEPENTTRRPKGCNRGVTSGKAGSGLHGSIKTM